MARDKPYKWQVGGPLPHIAAHSLAKHRVISEYLKRYVEHLTRTPAQETLRLTLVDGFAGGGRYRDDEGAERPGSPLLMLQAMEEAQLACSAAREKAFHLDTEFHFVESDAAAVEHLRHVLGDSDWSGRVGHDVIVHHGSFDQRCRAIVEAIRGRGRAHRAIFLLDQYGYKDVPFPLLRDILEKLPSAEIILTFATDWLTHYLADTPESRGVLQRLGVPLPLHELLALKGLTGERQKIQFILHGHLVQASGARFFTPFFIRSDEAHKDYWLVHLSSHHRARDVMTTLHWEQHNYFAHFGHPGVGMLGYRPDRDVPQLGFYFDDQAAARTRAALMNQLPGELWNRPDGVVVDDLYRDFANEMPAGTAQLGDALASLRDEGQVEILGPAGGRKRGQSVNPMDLVVPRRQLILPGLARRPVGTTSTEE